MPKLKKADFDEKYRFRESREKGLVSCLNCNNIIGTNDEKGDSFCNHEERLIRIKIAEYWRGCWGGKGESKNISSKRVCNAHKSKPLLEGVVVPILPEKHLILLGSQHHDILHADPNCSYVIEELRIQKERKLWVGTSISDRSNLIPREIIWSYLCEMPCCDSKLPYQVKRTDHYRKKAGIKPDGTEPLIWIRKVVDHDKRVVVKPKDLESVFDLKKFNSSEFKDIERKICAAMDYLRENCNTLGSKPLSEAINPVGLSNYHHFLENHLRSNNGLGLWVYDERLFDRDKNNLETLIRNLETIPEGFILCVDTKGFLDHRFSLNDFSIYGIVKPSDDKNLTSKGVSHFIDICAVSYIGSGNHYMGVFGNGFKGLENFDRE